MSEITFKLGDRVLLSKTSVYYPNHAHISDIANSYSSNPRDTVGTIVSLPKVQPSYSLGITVDWDNKTHNIYSSFDLVKALITVYPDE